MDVCRRFKGFLLRGSVFASSILTGDSPVDARGLGLEFMDYREYVFGDDIRHVDWRISARASEDLERLFVRVYRSERFLELVWAVDLTASMFFKDKPDILGFLVGIFGSLSHKLRDKVDLVLVKSDVKVFPGLDGWVAANRVLEAVCSNGFAGRGGVGSATGIIGRVSRNKSVVFLTDYAEKVEAFKRLARTVWAANGFPGFFFIATPGEMGKFVPKGVVPVGFGDRQEVVDLEKWARKVREHVVRVRASVGLYNFFQLFSLEEAFSRRLDIALRYMAVRSRQLMPAAVV